MFGITSINGGPFVNLFFLYCNASVFVKQKINHIYEKNSVVRYFMNGMNYSSKYLHSLVFNYRIEPMYNNWIAIGCIYKLNSSHDSYNEVYNDVTNINMNFEDRLSLFSNWYETCESILSYEKSLQDSIVIMKHGSFYVDRICNKHICLLDEPIELNCSSVRFLSIEYTHPHMKKSVILTLEKGHYVINNELFSPCFVRRLLEKQPQSYIFDMEYKLKLFDNNIKSIELDSNQYIIIKEDTYHILSMSG